MAYALRIQYHAHTNVLACQGLLDTIVKIPHLVKFVDHFFILLILDCLA